MTAKNTVKAFFTLSPTYYYSFIHYSWSSFVLVQPPNSICFDLENHQNNLCEPEHSQHDDVLESITSYHVLLNILFLFHKSMLRILDVDDKKKIIEI